MTFAVLDGITIVRTVVLALLALTIGALAGVFRLYLRAYRLVPRRIGLTPLHVAIVSVCVLGLEATLAWVIIDGLSTSREATPTIVVQTGLLGLWSVGIMAALGVVAEQQQRRVKVGRGQPTVTITEPEVVEINDEGSDDRRGR